MTKTIRNIGWTSLCLAILAFFWAGCSKAGSTKTVGSVTYLSLIHGAPFTGTASVYLNDTLITQTSGIATGAFSPRYGTIRPGNYTAKFKKAGSDSLLDQLVASTYDTLNFYTLLLYNDPGGKAAHVLKILDDFSSVTNNGNAYYRFFNLAPEYPNVNLFISGTLVQSNRTPADNATNSEFNAFKSIQAGTYGLSVKDATTDSVLITSPSLSLAAGNFYSIWITGTKAQNNLSINVLQAQY